MDGRGRAASGTAAEGRFKCQALLDDTAVVAAMAYVDLNPPRAGTCDTLQASHHTSARQRLTEPELAFVQSAGRNKSWRWGLDSGAPSVLSSA